MKDQGEKAIVLVSFGTSYEDTRRKNLDRIEETVREAFPEYKVVSAWSCERLIRKVKRQQMYHADSISDALDRLLEEGIRECVIQPTFVTAGVELEKISELLPSYKDCFARLRMGDPLLASAQDVKYIADVFINHYWETRKDACLLFMGHGTVRDADSFYYLLNEQFRKNGCEDMGLGTIEEQDSMDRLVEIVRKSEKNKVVLIPFLLTAGRHVEKDMMGMHPKSWKSQLEHAGYEVTGVIKGLAEYDEILELYVSHVCQTMGISSISR